MFGEEAQQSAKKREGYYLSAAHVPQAEPRTSARAIVR
jgi:hypothetical protein